MTRRRAVLSLLPAVPVILTGCSARPPQKPELPPSVAPGWTLRNFASATPPSGIPATTAPICWEADYVTSTNATAEARVCGYSEEASAFDAMQRARAEANTVKFQEGKYLTLVQWRGVSREEITALVRALQKSLNRK